MKDDLWVQVADLYDAIQQLKDCVKTALTQCEIREGCESRPEDVLDDEWAS